jgi:hypothetical protein
MFVVLRMLIMVQLVELLILLVALQCVILREVIVSGLVLQLEQK